MDRRRHLKKMKRRKTRPKTMKINRDVAPQQVPLTPRSIRTWPPMSQAGGKSTLRRERIITLSIGGDPTIQRYAKEHGAVYHPILMSRQNPRNWSRGKRFFVTFEICFLTFSVYIGSAIYTAGVQDVEKVFGVAQVPATLGLTLFVLGYGKHLQHLSTRSKLIFFSQLLVL
jgi:Ca2+/Na+ antiporter